MSIFVVSKWGSMGSLLGEGGALLLVLLSFCACGAVQVPAFRRVILDDDFPGGYQVKVADIDGDGRPDVVALGEGRPGQIAWYKNPSWKRYPISVEGTKENVDLAVHDIDGDGQVEIAVASDFRFSDSSYGGTISWLKRRATLDEPWSIHRIDAEPTAHRIRWADVDGDGRKELIAAPLLGRGAKPPGYEEPPARLVLYRIPGGNVQGAWSKEVIDETLHVTHGLEVYDFDGDGREEVLTTSFEGVHLFDLKGKGENARWVKVRLCRGNQQQENARGSSEVCVGRLRGGKRFIATIDPWHGNEVVVHLPSGSGGDGLWERHVIDESLSQGHAICCADFNGDGADEILAGFRGRKGGISIYCSTDESGAQWEKSVLDEGGIAAQGFSVFDMSTGDASSEGNRPPDLIAVGGATHNVHLYVNVTGSR
jgi:hypothetical protein